MTNWRVALNFILIDLAENQSYCLYNDRGMKYTVVISLRAILQESEAKLEMKIFNPPSFFVWR